MRDGSATACDERWRGPATGVDVCSALGPKRRRKTPDHLEKLACGASREERQAGEVDDTSENDHERHTRFDSHSLGLERMTRERHRDACRARSEDDSP